MESKVDKESNYSMYRVMKIENVWKKVESKPMKNKQLELLFDELNNLTYFSAIRFIPIAGANLFGKRNLMIRLNEDYPILTL